MHEGRAHHGPVQIELGERALGAQAVAVGRATLYGAAAGGEAGVRQALAILASELERAMQLCGVARVQDMKADLIALELKYRA